MNRLLLPLREHLSVYRPEPPEVDASVLIPVTLEDEPRVILTRRASHMNSHAGEVAFPGGKRDVGDPDFVSTALRESEEEIGLSRHDVNVIGQLDVFTSRVGLRVQPFVGLVSPGLELKPNPEEIESIFTVPLGFFLEHPPAYTHRVSFMGHEFVVPSFNYQDYVIWGLTGFMIVDLMNRVYDAGIEFRMPAGIVPKKGGNQ